MTVRQHLEFYARLKGIKREKEREYVKEALREYGLQSAAERASKDLSGGMKRRLSVAISFIGFSKLIILDEPTTGLDSVSRRKLWEIIEKSKRNRVILLTTHAMDECELLSNRIGILANGRMECLGTSTSLKKLYSDGFKLTVSFNPEDAERVKAGMCEFFEGILVKKQFKGTLEFALPIPEGGVSRVFSEIMTSAASIGIIDWSLSQGTLENVFLRINSQTNQQNNEDTLL